MKSSLGRGLQSLIPQKNSNVKTAGPSKSVTALKELTKLKKESIFNIEIDKIRPNPNQPRKEISQEQLKELAMSIKEYGILQPLIVTKIERETERGQDVEYELVAGERRWRAAQLVKVPRVPVIIKDDSKRVKFEMALVENIQRENLNPMEMAMAFKRLYDEFGLKHEEIAKRVGKSRPTVSNIIRLLNLPPAAQTAIAENKLTEAHGRAILTVKPEAQMAFLGKILRGNWGVRLTEEKSRELADENKNHAPRSQGPKCILFRSLEQKIGLAMSRRVSITKRGSMGRITIEFKDEKELDKIASHLVNF